MDRQLFGRSGRQGDPGSAQAFVSAEDELVRRHLPPAVRRALTTALSGKLPARDRVSKSAFRLAQHRAQKLAYQQRQEILNADLFLDEALSFAAPDPVG